MAAITQTVSNYLGGVSNQPDNKKINGQVRTCLNAYPDPTFGLTKRPGFSFTAALGTSSEFTDSKWFFIQRDEDEAYFGVIRSGSIRIWNADSGVECTVTMVGSAASYLDTVGSNYDILTVQDTSIITNKTKVVAAEPAPTTWTANTVATIRLKSVEYMADYTITKDGSSYTYHTKNDDNYEQNDPPGGESAVYKLDADDILSDLAAHTGVTTTYSFPNSLELINNSSFRLEVKGGIVNDGLESFQDQVENVAMLPNETRNGRLVQVMNTDSDKDSYWAKFIADAGSNDGRGFWEETIAPNVSTGLDDATMPHELINQSLNQFTFQQIEYAKRLVGDEETNSPPSFVGSTIQQAFFYSNRLGFLTADNVSMSQAGEYYNFYHISALTQTVADPVDLSCSSVKPAVLHGVIPTTQGIVLFSKYQQFLMYAQNGVFTPVNTVIKTLSNYEMDTTIDPVDMGSNIAFLSKTPSYTRIFSMYTRGQNENPIILDTGKVIAQWIPKSMNQLIASPQNSFIAMASQDTPYVYLYRTYNDGEEDIMQSWFNWKLPGDVLFFTVSHDKLIAVTSNEDQVVSSIANLNLVPTEETISSATADANPCIDLYSVASSVTYDPATKTTKAYLPYTDITGLTPILLIASGASSFDANGFTVTPDRGNDGNPYFSILNEDFSSIASQVIVGYRYDYDVTLPTTYYKLDQEGMKSDYTANLTIARHKFSLGLTGVCSFKMKAQGSSEWYEVSPVKDADYYLADDVPLVEQKIFTLPIHQKNTNYSIRIFSDSPFPVSLNSMMWEGNYSPRYYTRR